MNIQHSLKAVLVAACVTAAGSAVGAQGVLYDCDITKRQEGVDWIARKYAFVVQDTGVSVIDPVILQFVEQPIVVQPRKRANGLQLKWTVSAEDSRKTVARMSYRAVLNTTDNTVTVRVTPVGYPQGWNGKGQCTTRQR